MNPKINTYKILLANDRKEVQFLIEEALTEVPLSLQLFCVKDGEELVDYLYRRNHYKSPETSPRPNLILLDLNMPRKDGREALLEIKSDSTLRQIPVLILTTSQQDGDLSHCYGAGANSFINLPLSFDTLVEFLKRICQYWFQTVILPPLPED
ncbi:response regulator [Ancylothrix sp. C2]|uniref:response regulator n=1 Tax=Ancylothrix sp. D3o TaxID=2953691 RepID=UPI0021BAC5E7|nr:response regulator [Ancylothrix sp. D3o]MCT7951749.1 response regulator [Ancylothrix sp. D3o]